MFHRFLIADNYIKTQQFHLAGKFGLEEKCSAIEEEDSVENVEEGFQEGREAAEHLESGLLVTEVLVGWDIILKGHSYDLDVKICKGEVDIKKNLTKYGHLVTINYDSCANTIGLTW